MISIAIVVIKSIGRAYTALNLVGDLEVLEFSPLGEKGQLIVSGDPQKLKNFVRQTSTVDIERSLVLPCLSEKILRSYLSLDNSPLQDRLLIVEGKFIGDLFRIADEALKMEMSIVDLRLTRSQGSPCHLILTAPQSIDPEDWADRLGRDGYTVTHLAELSPALKSFMAI